MFSVVTLITVINDDELVVGFDLFFVEQNRNFLQIVPKVVAQDFLVMNLALRRSHLLASKTFDKYSKDSLFLLMVHKFLA